VIRNTVKQIGYDDSAKGKYTCLIWCLSTSVLIVGRPLREGGGGMFFNATFNNMSVFFYGGG
jgi:hypothetical protein